MIRGYKCFNGDFTNRYGIKFDVGSCYNVSGSVKFGILGNGFHMCKNLVDVFRYYETSNDNFIVCEVVGSGNYECYNDEYNGFYNMYSVECIEIIRIIDRGELIEMVINMNEFMIVRFIQLFRMTYDEICLFYNKFGNVNTILLALDYYQLGNKNAYNDYYKFNKVRRKVCE